MLRIVVFLSFLFLIACSAVKYDLPAVSTEGDGRYRPGKFVWHDLISDDTAASQKFFTGLFGWQFRKLPLVNADYWIISLEGTPIGGMVRQRNLSATKDVSQWVSVMSVDDAMSSMATVKDLGGTVLREPVSVGSRGTMAVYADPAGAIFATLQTPDGDAPDARVLPGEGAFFWHELWTSDVDRMTSFYTTLTGLAVKARDSEDAAIEPGVYRVLRDSTSGSPRAGVRSLPDEEMPTLWMPYLRVVSEARLDEILLQVTQLGGRVLVPATARPVGGYLAIIAGPSGAPIALQTWVDEQSLLEDM